MKINMISLILCLNFVFADESEPLSSETTLSDHSLTTTEWHTLYDQYEEELKHSKRLEVIGWIVTGVGILAAPNYADLPHDEQFQYLLTCGVMVGIGIPLGVVQHRKRMEVKSKITRLNPTCHSE